MVDSVVEELARKRLGRTIKGKWRLDRLLGVGGMAAVYAATHRNGARVAIKMLHATISASQQIRARFVREGYLANKVDHPGVVRVLDDDIDDQDQAAFLVMDLVLGSTLSDRAMERLLNDGEVLDVAEQVLQVLASAHKQGIIHRDLKPDNLLVDNVGKVHVLDFGIARLLDDATGNVSATKTGTAFGTPGFMAPEQALGKQHLITAKTDLYALGATLFALVCGDFVHAAENPQELMVLVATQPARSLGELAPHMAKDVIALIDRATRNEPDQRWPSAEAMLAEVRRVKAKLGITSSPVLPLKNGDGLDLTPPPHVWASPPPPGGPSAKPATTPAAAAGRPAAPPRPTPKGANVFAPTPGNPPPRVSTSPGMPAARATPAPADLAPSMLGEDDLLESDRSPMAPAGRFGEPEVMAQLRNSTPAASFDARAPTPLGALESGMQTPVAPNRRRMGTVIAVVGTAALLGVIAIAVSSTRGRPTSTASDHSAESTSQPTTTKSPATSDTASESATTTAATGATTAAPTATTTTTTTVATTGATTTTSLTTSTAGKPFATIKGTATAPTVKASATASVKKPIDVGY